MSVKTNKFEPEIIGEIVEGDKRVVIKVKGSTTVALEKTLLDKIAIKHFGALYSEVEKETNNYVREKYVLLREHGFKGVAYLRVILQLELIDEKLGKNYVDAIRKLQEEKGN